MSKLMKYYEHMVQGDHFNLASVSESSIQTILKAAGPGNLSGRFLKVGATFLFEPITYLISQLP